MKRIVTNPLAPHNKKELIKWNVKNIADAINVLIQKMKAILSVSGAFKWAQNHGMQKTLYLAINIFVLFAKVQKMESVKF